MILYEQKDIDRLYSKISIITEGKYNGCWEVDCCKNKGGYHDFTINGKTTQCHRFMYMIHHQDENIDSFCVCHTCDNSGCVNPEHLWLGTSQENTQDKVNKNRQSKGSNHSKSKLTEIDVEEMLINTLSGYFTTYKEIMYHYHISLTTVHDLITMKSWTHVTKKFDMKKIWSLLDNYHGVNNPFAYFNKDDIRDIRQRLKNGESQSSIAKSYNAYQQTISLINLGKTYQNVI